MNLKTIAAKRAVSLLLLIAVVATACTNPPKPALPTALPPATPTPLPPKPSVPFTPTNMNEISPVVIQRTPEKGERLAPNAAIELVFDRAMNQASVAQALLIQPAVRGKLSWKNERTATFTPDAALPRNSTFDIALTQSAKAADGNALAAPYQFRFQTQGNLEAGQTIPADGASEIDPNTRITILFNHPVVPLTGIAQQNTLPQPLSFEPALAGKQEWLNTSILVFYPSQPLPGGTKFTARVASDLTDTDGNPLAKEFVFSFSTAAPKVMSIGLTKSPIRNEVPFYSPRVRGSEQQTDLTQPIRVDTGIVVQFNQAINPATAQQAFGFFAADGAPVQGSFAISDTTLTFTPTQQLRLGSSYRLVVNAGVQSASGGIASTEKIERTLTTVPLPKIIGTAPANDQLVDPYQSFIINFNTEIDPATVMPHINVSPEISLSKAFTYYDSYNKQFVIGINPMPATDYVVAISPGIADPYGNATEENLTVKFRTGDVQPSAQIALPYGVVTFDASQPVRVVADTMNVSELRVALYKFENLDDAQVAFQGYDNALPEKSLLRKFTAQINGQPNRPQKTAVSFAEGDGKLPPGIYVIEVTSTQIRYDWRQRHALVVSNINLTLKHEGGNALVWATDLQTGKPVPNLALDFYARDDSTNPPKFIKMGNAGTNNEGVALFSGGTKLINAVVASNPFGIVQSDWGNGVRPFDFGMPFIYDYNGGRENTLKAFAYTDRPIYRPAQTVFVKGIVRSENDVKFSLPMSGFAVRVLVTDPTGQNVLDKQVRLDAYGAFSAELKLAEGAPLGAYAVQVAGEGSLYYGSFTVAAYRPPEYEVSIATDKPEAVRGDTVRATATSQYLSGGALQNAAVNWNVLVRGASFSPPNLEQYTFTDYDDPWRCFDCWYLQQPEQPAQPFLQGTGNTNERGQLSFELPIPPEIKDFAGKPLAGPVELSIEANATGADNQVIAGRSSVLVHPADLYVGIGLSEYLIQANKVVTADVIAVNTQGARLANTSVTAEIFKRSWDSTFVADEFGGGQWQTKVSDELVSSSALNSDANGEATVPFTAPTAGSYRIVVSTKDAQGRVARSSRFVWVTGNEFVPWLRENNDRVNLIVNKAQFKAGETAEILIPSPFVNANARSHLALVTVERGHILQHEVITIDSSSYVYRLPITDEFAPNIYVSVVSLNGGERAVNKLAEFKVGYAALKVDIAPKKIQIEIKPSTMLAEPGKTITYAIRATDSTGKPVQAQFSLDLVDKGILNLQPRSKDEIVNAFYGVRGNAVNTSVGLSISGNRVTNEQLNYAIGGGGAMAEAPAATAAPAAAPAAPMADGMVAKSRMSSVGNVAQTNAPTVRENFADTAFWKADVQTDSEGNATIEITLPDNLTTWVLRAVGVDTNTKVGENTLNVVATKPLLIRPVTPRFFVVGDVVQVGAVVNNNTDTPQDATVTLNVDGAAIQTNNSAQTVSIPKNSEAKVNWTIAISDVPNVQLVFAVQNDNFGDASKPRLATAPNGGLKVNKYSAPEIVGTAGELRSEGTRTEVIALPPGLDATQGELTVRLNSSLAGALQSGLTYLQTFPYECAEQVTSKFLPNVLTYKALKDLVIPNAELEAKLKMSVNDGVSRLAQLQHEDGGWGWWREDESNPHVSAYAVYGLTQAKENGFAVDENMLQRGIAFLQNNLRALSIESPFYQLNQQAHVLFVLSESGNANDAKIRELFGLRSNLSHFGKALLLMAMGKGDAKDERIKTLFADLNAAVIQSATGAHWEENNTDWWAMNNDTRTTAIVLSALAKYDTKNTYAPNVVRWLMVARNADGYWSSTQETAWSLIALTDWMRASGELRGNFEFGAFVNDEQIISAIAGRGAITQTQTAVLPLTQLVLDNANRLTIARNGGDGRLYYTAHLKTYAPVPSLKAQDRGIRVQRRYTLASCEQGNACADIDEAKVGDVIRVNLTLIAPSDLHYIQLEDFIPAGADLVDTGLATTSQLASAPSLTSQDEARNAYGWWWRWYSRSELRDDRVALFAPFLNKGTYEYSYTFRVTAAGAFNVIPTFVNEQYFPEVFGRSDGRLFTVK